jgi:hypothetical protein
MVKRATVHRGCSRDDWSMLHVNIFKDFFILHIEEKHIYLHFNLYSSLHLFTFLFTSIYIHLLSRMHLNRFPLRHKRTIKAQTSRYNVSGCCSRSLTRRRWAPARWNDISMKDIYGISLGIEWEILGIVMYIMIYIYILYIYYIIYNIYNIIYIHIII